MSPELETLDQLLGGDLSLAVIRRLFPDDESFLKGVRTLLLCGDVVLLDADGSLILNSRWRELLGTPVTPIRLNALKLRLTDQGARTIS